MTLKMYKTGNPGKLAILISHCKILLLISILALPAKLDAQSRRPMTIDDVMNIARIGDVLITPDGDKVFYSVAKLDWEKNKYKKKYFLISSGGGQPQEFIGKDGGSKFQFSPDGKFLSFLREVDKTEQLFIMPVEGGEAVKSSDLKCKIQAYRWSKDSRQIFFVAEDTLSSKEQGEWDKGADAFYVDEGANGKSAGRWSNLWQLDPESGKSSMLTNEELIIEEFDVSPDGNTIVFSARPDNRQNYPHHAELFLYTPGNPQLERLTSNRAPESNPRWSPDGKRILYRSPDKEEFELRCGYFWIMDPATGKSKMLKTQNQGEMTGSVVWHADGKSILYCEARGTNSNLHRLFLSGDRSEQLSNRKGSLRAMAFSKDRNRVIYTFSDFTRPAELYVSDLKMGQELRLTNVNSWAEEEINLGKADVLKWNSSDGTEIEGIFLLPSAYQKGSRVPLILTIHGGPPGVFTNSFDAYLHYLTGQGYAVLGPNVRGSTGYGDDILRGLMGDVGGGEFEDAMTGVDHVVELDYVDPDRMGVRGWSWGGVSTSWVVTHTDRFKAASCGAGVVSWLSESGPGFNYDVSLWYIGGTAWENPELWRDHSSITHVKNAKTPTLLLHGAEDVTSSTNQSMIFYTALRDLGVPTRFLKFPRQKHGIREPRHQRIRMTEEIKWFNKYILEKDWEEESSKTGLIE